VMVNSWTWRRILSPCAKMGPMPSWRWDPLVIHPPVSVYCAALSSWRFGAPYRERAKSLSHATSAVDIQQSLRLLITLLPMAYLTARGYVGSTPQTYFPSCCSQPWKSLQRHVSPATYKTRLSTSFQQFSQHTILVNN
jgi:hypothetical protein